MKYIVVGAAHTSKYPNEKPVYGQYTVEVAESLDEMSSEEAYKLLQQAVIQQHQIEIVVESFESA